MTFLSGDRISGVANDANYKRSLSDEVRLGRGVKGARFRRKILTGSSSGSGRYPGLRAGARIGRDI